MRDRRPLPRPRVSFPVQPPARRQHRQLLRLPIRDYFVLCIGITSWRGTISSPEILRYPYLKPAPFTQVT